MRLASLLGASALAYKQGGRIEHTTYFEREFPRILHTLNGQVGPALRCVVAPSAKHLGLGLMDAGNSWHSDNASRARRRVELGLEKIKALAANNMGLVEVRHTSCLAEVAQQVCAHRQCDKTPWIINVEPTLDSSCEDELVCKAVKELDVGRVLVVQAWCESKHASLSGSALSLARRLGSEIYTAAFFLRPDNHPQLAAAVKAVSNGELRRLGVERLPYL